MKRTFVVAVMIMALVMATAATTFAGFTWCMTDPIIQLPGDQGRLNLIVSVPDGSPNAPVALKVWAPEGSSVVGNTGNVTVDLKKGKEGQLTVQVEADVPVQLNLEYGSVVFDSYTFDDGKGKAEWSWQ